MNGRIRMGIDGLPEPFKSFYQSDPEAFNWQLKNFEAIGNQVENWPKWATQFAIAESWSKAMGSLFSTPGGMIRSEGLYPPEPQGPPHEWDFRNIKREKPLAFKTPDHAARLIKK